MIWFNIKELERKISSNELSDRDAYDYVLAHFIVSALTIYACSGTGIKWVDGLNVILLVLIVIVGMNKTYKTNDEIDGKDFLKRFFAISWVVGIRLTLVAILFAVIIGIAEIIVGGKELPVSNSFNNVVRLVLMVVVEIAYYLLIIKSLRRLTPVRKLENDL